jgi:3-hydroxymyristoyl/3-hydroxydecanoyl-(acyl carrier protein) dehydratase
MQESWFHLSDFRYEPPDRIEADATVPDDSLFFSGHFPKMPVVPGIAMVAMVERTLNRHASRSGLDRSITGLRRVRFRSLIESGSSFHLIIAPHRLNPELDFTFEVIHRDKKACDGVIRFCSERHASPLQDEPPDNRKPLDVAIEDCIPHRDRMKVIDSLLEIGEEHCVTRADVNERWPLVDSGATSSVVLIEVAAQTASSLISWKRRYKEETGGRGFLVGVKLAKWSHSRIPVGTRLFTHVKVIMQRDNYLVFASKVISPPGLSAEIQFQAFRPNDGDYLIPR